MNARLEGGFSIANGSLAESHGMLSGEWIELFERIPFEQHNQIVLMTSNGIELSVELLLRLEPGYVVFRGRICGQNDDGRAFFLPFDQITYVNINRFVKEEEFGVYFGELMESPCQSPIIDESLTETPPPSPILVQPAAIAGSGNVVRVPTSIAANAKPSVPSKDVSPQPPATMVPPPVSLIQPRPAPVNVAPLPAPAATNSHDIGSQKSSILERLRAQRGSTGKAHGK